MTVETRVVDPYAVKRVAALEDHQTELDEPGRLLRVDLSDLANCATNPTRYAIESILPRGHVTLLGGHGGSGKTNLAETFAAHTVTGTSWAGLHADHDRVVFVSLEDPGELARYRLRRVCDEYGLPHSAMDDNMLILDGSATDSVLALEISNAGIRHLVFTATLDEIETAADGCGLLVIDNASDAFAGNENDRYLVRAFIRRLAHIARKHNCAVLLLAHIDKAAARHGSAGNTYSGSTAWHNTCRSRLALLEDEAGPYLVHEKNNHGKRIDPIRLAWTDEGVLVPISTTGSATMAREEQDDADVLAAIRAAIEDGATVHAARSGSHSTLSVLKTYPDLPKALIKDKGRFWSALTRLERAGSLKREVYKDSHRHERVRLVCSGLCDASTPTPPDARTRTGCARALVVSESDERGTNARTQNCPRCDGAGCEWCRHA